MRAFFCAAASLASAEWPRVGEGGVARRSRSVRKCLIGLSAGAGACDWLHGSSTHSMAMERVETGAPERRQALVLAAAVMVGDGLMGNGNDGSV